MFLGGLCLLRHFLFILSEKKIRVREEYRPAGILILAFGLTAFLSSFMPMVIAGDIRVLDTYSNLMGHAKPKALYFSFQYVTQALYFLFGCLLAYYFAIKNDTPEKLERSIRIYLYASLFAACWGLMEFILFYLDIPYPSFLFNTNGKSVNIDGTLTLNDRPRITSISLEPSILSQQLLTAIPLVFWPLWEGADYLKSKFFKLTLILTTVAVLALCLSTTAYFGLAFFPLLVLLHYLKRKKVNIGSLTVVVAGTIIFVFLAPVLAETLKHKLSTFSGFERLRALEYGWLYFTQSPILGIGWGVFPSWDLIICILTGMGTIGLLILVLIVFLIYLNFRNQKINHRYTTLSRSLFHSLIMLLVISQFSGFIYHSQYFWLILGLALAASGLHPSTNNIQPEPD